MDQNELSYRLCRLAGASACQSTARNDDFALIIGSLGFACAVRRAQGIALLAVLLGLCLWAMREISVSSLSGLWGVTLLLVASSMVAVRFFPYWTPPKALRTGLIALSEYPLNDPAQFIAHQRTPINALSNALLSDLCLQLALDRRRPKAHSI
jgi:hypothetical protein